MALIGNLVYLSVFISIVFTVVFFKFIQNKTWDNVSIRCGQYVLKGAMLVAG